VTNEFAGVDGVALPDEHLLSLSTWDLTKASPAINRAQGEADRMYPNRACMS